MAPPAPTSAVCALENHIGDGGTSVRANPHALSNSFTCSI